METGSRDCFDHGVVDLDLDSPADDAFSPEQLVELASRNQSYRLGSKGVEDDDAVDAVEELRTKKLSASST